VKKILVLILEFVLLSLPLTWLWMEGGREAYGKFLLGLLVLLRESFGLEYAGRVPAVARFFGYVPFLVLVAITPGIGLKRRVVGFVVGGALILASHLALCVAVNAAQAEHGGTSGEVAAIFPYLLMADAFPFLLWAVVASGVIGSALSRFTGAGAPRTPFRR
jgi:hypothetical protein